MKREINSIVEEVIAYGNQLTHKRGDLTEIQKREFHKKIQKELYEKGIFFDSEYCEFDLSKYNIEGSGRVLDVKISGSFPLSLAVTNAKIFYEPRDLSKLSESDIKSLENIEYINFKIGDNIPVSGKITRCKYYYSSSANHLELWI